MSSTGEMDDNQLKQLLRDSNSIACVGSSVDPTRPSNFVMKYLKQAGYRVYAINPRYAGRTIHGETVLSSLAEIPERIDIVAICRRVGETGPVVEEAIANKARAIWMPRGVRNERAARKARAAGLRVVMDRCAKTEHARLLAS